MKKIFTALLSSATAFCLAACGNAGQTSSAERKESFSFKFSTHYDGDSETAKALTDYFNAVSEATDGHVSVFPIYGAGIASPREVSRYVSLGIVEMGHMSTMYDDSVFPLSDVVSLPMRGADDNLKTTRLLYDLYDEFPAIRDEWDNSWKVLSIYTVPEKLLKGDLPQFGRRPDGMASVLSICVNMDVWNSLPEEYRTAIDAVSGRDQALVFAEAAAADLKKETDILEEIGYEYLSQDDPDHDEWLQACEAYGYVWGRTILEQTKGAVDGENLNYRSREILAGY